MPKRVVIAGGGYIANEFAGIFHGFGAHVTIVNRTDQILRGYDEQIRDRLLQISMTKGIDFRFHAPFERVEKNEDGTLLVHVGGGGEPIHCDVLLFATGRVPKTDGLGLADAGVELDKYGAVVVDADNRSTVDSIYAVGDVTNRVQLTPVAIREGQAFADTVFGNKPHRVDYENIPSAVFSHPPMAGVGMTEAQARNKLGSVKVYTSDFRAMKNVLAGRHERALYKMIVEAETEKGRRPAHDRAGRAGDIAGGGGGGEGRPHQARVGRYGGAASVDGGGTGAAEIAGAEAGCRSSRRLGSGSPT